jgi:hypothetical protein
MVPSNSAFAPVILTPEDARVVVGKVTATVRDLEGRKNA